MGGVELRALLRSHGLAVADVADALGVESRTLRSYFSGHMKVKPVFAYAIYWIVQENIVVSKL